MKPQNSKFTLLDYAILGLLQFSNLSGYQIRKEFEQTALGNYSSSPGTIYPALNKLKRWQVINKIFEPHTKKTKFQINEQGILALRAWVIKPIEKFEVEKKMDELLLRFAFMENLTTQEEITRFLYSLRDLLSKHINELQLYLKIEFETLPLHGRLALDHGIETNKATLKWCKKIINQHINKK